MLHIADSHTSPATRCGILRRVLGYCLPATCVNMDPNRARTVFCSKCVATITPLERLAHTDL